MRNEERDIQRKLRVLQYAEKIGNVRKACRYFGIARSSLYRWRDAYHESGELGLINAKSIPKNPANQTPPEIVDKVLYLRRKYHLGPISAYSGAFGHPFQQHPATCTGVSGHLWRAALRRLVFVSVDGCLVNSFGSGFAH